MKKGNKITFGQKAADKMTKILGSWKFIIIQSIILLCWLIYNVLSGKAFDPYPFILLNLALSFQAAYASPMILMSGNRQSEIDRAREEKDLETDKKAEKEVEDIQNHLHRIENKMLVEIINKLEKIEKKLEKLG